MLQLSPPLTLHHDWVNMAEVQLQIATYKHTPAARVRNLCAWPMLPYRFGVPVCSAPVTARAGSDSGAPRPLTGLVLCSSACAAHAWAYQMLGRCAPLTGLGSVVLPAASVCVYAQVPERIWQVQR